ncbi:hypothetical protein F4782DRAFT_63525 [Xylaria castorea]|nr:hypothetical protein F4782DRAFT_63525 [Xylaria castorea]
MESSPERERGLDQDMSADIPHRKSSRKSSHSVSSCPDAESPNCLHEGQALQQSQITGPKLPEFQFPSTSVTCPAIGVSHSHLLEFDIHICPKRQSHIYGSDTEEMPPFKEGLLKIDHATLSQSLEQRVDGELDLLTQVKQIKKDIARLYKKTQEECSSSSESEDEVEEFELDGLGESERDDHDFSGGDRDATDALQGTGEEGGDAESKLREHMNKSDVTRVTQKLGRTDHETGIFHEIRFHDVRGGTICQRRWKGPFDLAQVRKGAEDFEQKTILKITTDLGTNIPDESSLFRRDDKRLAKADILRNPRVQFLYIKQKMEVKSKQLINILRTMIRYYPSINLQGETLVLESPSVFWLIISVNLKTLKMIWRRRTPCLSQTRTLQDLKPLKIKIWL